jgi:1,2-dihydroxy-3-keto-5-methylthiopentene dioxygenase
MSALTIYNEEASIELAKTTDFTVIAEQLNKLGVQFERWAINNSLTSDTNSDTILENYRDSINTLNAQYGFQSVDVIHLNANHPDKVAIRQKFLAEHTHDDFEIRFFVRGCGLFYLHIANKVYAVLCEQGDLISVPANTAHWFDLGTEPQLSAIRLFTTSEGWLATFSGSDIGLKFPSLDEYIKD